MNNKSKSKSRIAILDGFRALAIIAVLFFHFFSRYTTNHYKTNLYPYADKYDYFGYGYLGVEFFFIISGFVIFFTLEQTNNFIVFWKKRLIRLWPSMFIASIIIFIFFRIFDDKSQGAQLINFLPSLSFIKPNLINNTMSFFGTETKIGYLNGSFWSLWLEIQFYVFSSFLYFMNKKNFVRNFLVLSSFLCLINVVIHTMHGENRLGLPFAYEISIFYDKWFDNGFNLIGFLPFFSIGVIFYLFFKNKNSKIVTSTYVKGFLLFFVVFEMIFAKDWGERIAFLLMYLLFFVFIYFPDKLSFLEKPFLSKTGEASYFLYLIHENIGVYIIVALGSYFLPLGFVLPLLIMIAFTVLSILYTYTIDKKINKWLKGILLKK